jgi:biopolymer transport protein ExbB
METLDPILSTLPPAARAFAERAVGIWVAGDWAMLAIAAVAFLLFALGIKVRAGLFLKRYRSHSDRKLRSWIADPSLRRGEVGRLIDEVQGIDDVHAIGVVFESVHAAEIAPFRRDLRLIRVGVTAAPLLGLFGTVTGMLATFSALSSGSGGEKTMSMIAAGISEALITTETGLVVALPGVFFQYLLSRKVAAYEQFLEHLESLLMQAAWRRTHPPAREAIPSGITREMTAIQETRS